MVRRIRIAVSSPARLPTRFWISIPSMAEQAAEALPESLTALSSKLTAALTEGGSERLCYVFACEAEDGTPVSVYIDAKTGVQTKIEIGRT